MQYKFSGMTVFKRLYVAGLMNDFETCLKQKNFEGINFYFKES